MNDCCVLTACVQTARTWRRGGTASSSKYRRFSTTAWTNFWSASRDRYDCVKRDLRPVAWTELNVVHLDRTTATRRSAVSSEQPSPRSENCSVVADPSNPRHATTSLSHEIIPRDVAWTASFKTVERVCIAHYRKPIAELRSIIRHMGSHSVTCHLTHRLNHSQVGTRFTYPGAMEG